ncbi:uncharacterized protein BDR25DRAFT_260105 [Lindgomyces ingoldianus]|uniref:Uncharacterized protein n=1 Tax=Lindgomyces ingoldianus TaxID=673940 RepID=A0ACB6QZX7_9PLEO|nr:uncharacterized protein BDR25DRAFT_260105 [Lindgomyces ingoldianus]KAF2471620.1 hypothetical protein BDR25DRAFT_260105 [Lindgomyces ingoldianus]
MARATVVKEQSTSSSTSQGQGEPKGNKRRCVQSACVPCRKRKSKCDGGTPVCATCTAVYQTDCFYDLETESRRTKATAQKRDSLTVTATTSDSADFIINLIRTLPEREVYELIRHIKKDPFDLASLAESWKKTTVTLPHTTTSAKHSLEGDLSLLLGKPATTRTGESRHFGHTSSLGLVPEDENYTCSRVPTVFPERHRNGTWTTVTDDIHFVNRLLELYFMWSHPFYIIFSRECFYKDFRSGRQKYCSPLLVNALLAYACHFSDEPRARLDPGNPRTAGDHFFAEARRLLFEDESPSITTTQALCVMAMREPSAGRDSSGFMYIGRCIRMVVELGLHLQTSACPPFQLTSSEIEVRKVTFWGCFVVDTAWSVCIGRITQLPRAAINLDKPILDEPITTGNYGTCHHNSHHIEFVTVTSRMFLQAFSALSELVNDNNYMFFAPKDRFTDRRLIETYKRYQTWYNNLPPPLRVPDNPNIEPQPHIVVLHMYYYTIILHLFRPLLKYDLIHSDIRPREMCIGSANKISEFLRLYRQHYKLRCGHLILTHILLSVCIVHLLYSKDYETSAAGLLEGLQALEELSTCHYFGARSFKIVHALAKTWNLPFPDALKNSKLIPREDTIGISPLTGSLVTASMKRLTRDISTNGCEGVEPPGSSVRWESLPMFALLQHKQHGHPTQVPAAQASMIRQHNTSTSLQYASSTSSPMTTTTTAEQLFWTPIKGVGVPLLPRTYHLSPMDLNNMLGSEDEWGRFGRDGFKMSDRWVQEPIGFNGGAHRASSGMDGAPGISGSEPRDNLWESDRLGPRVG